MTTTISVRVKPLFRLNIDLWEFILIVAYWVSLYAYGYIVTHYYDKCNLLTNFLRKILKKILFWIIVRFSFFSALHYFFRLEKSFILYAWSYT